MADVEPGEGRDQRDSQEDGAETEPVGRPGRLIDPWREPENRRAGAYAQGEDQRGERSRGRSEPVGRPGPADAANRPSSEQGEADENRFRARSPGRGQEQEDQRDTECGSGVAAAQAYRRDPAETQQCDG